MLPVAGSTSLEGRNGRARDTLARDQQIAQLQALVQVLLQVIVELQRQKTTHPSAATTPI